MMLTEPGSYKAAVLRWQQITNSYSPCWCDGAAGLVVLQVQCHIGLRVNQGLRRGGHV